MGVFAAKLFNFCSDTIELRMRENSIFLVPVKYTLVCHASALAVLGCTTYCRVSCCTLAGVGNLQPWFVAVLFL